MTAGDQPWWASGDDADTVGTDDPLAQHRKARQGEVDPGNPTPGSRSTGAARGRQRRGAGEDPGNPNWQEELAEDIDRAGRDEPEPTPDVPHWLGDAVSLVGRIAVDATNRFQAAAQTDGGDHDPVDDHPAGRARRRHAATEDTSSAGGPGGGPPHSPGEVCNACPFCLGLRAVRQVRPEVIGHLSDAAHHLSLALRAIADAAADGPDDVEHIPLDD